MVISPEKRKKVFVTGASSLLMAQLLPKFHSDQYEIFGLSRNQIQSNDINYIPVLGDLEFPEIWQYNLEGIDLIIHAAAITHSFDEKSYYHVNYHATKILIDLAIKYKVPQFIYISSRTACENSGGYGLSKLYAEHYLSENFKNFTILRPSEIFGGAKNEGIEKLILDTIHNKLVVCPIQIENKMYPIHMEDTVELLAKYIFNQKDKNKIITINGPKAYDFLDIVNLTKKISGNKSIVIPVPKIAMFLIKNILKAFRINIGINPDQIDRLYCKKEFNLTEGSFISLESYIQNKVKQETIKQ